MQSFWRGLANLQVAKSGLIIGVAWALAAGSLPFVAKLGLNGDFTALLPEHKPSVVDLAEVRERFGRQATLSVAIEAATTTVARAFVAQLAPRVEALTAERVTAVDWNVSAFERFVEEHRHLYASLPDLEEIRDALADRLSYELGRQNPLYVDLTERDGPPPDPAEVARRLEKKAQAAQKELARFPDGYFQHPTRPLVVMFVRTSIQGGEIEQVKQLLAAVKQEADALAPEARGVTVHLGGEMMDIEEEQAALTQAVLWATGVTAVLVMLAIQLFFRRIRSIPLLALSVLPPVLITFAVAEVTVSYLNASSAFLSSIVLGNGINPNVIWLSRYFEARRAGEGLRDGVEKTHRATWAATLTASLAAGAAYGSLVITDFRGFRDFGIIGGAGMALCWLGAYLLLPALVSVFDRRWPMGPEEARSERGGSYGRLFARIALGAPRTVLVTSLALTVASLALVVLAVLDNPMEYDFRNLQSKRPPSSRTQWVNDRQSEIVDETTTGSAIAILVRDVEDVPYVQAQLERYRAETSSLAFGAVRTVWDFVPSDQLEKIEVLDEIRELMPKLERYPSIEDKELLERHRPPPDLVPLRPEDLPSAVSRYFAESDGSLGKVLFLEHHESRNAWDGEYLVEWAEAARSLKTKDGSRPAVAGQPPVFADLLEAIWVDGPRAVLAAFFATFVLLLLTFRRWSERFATVFALLLGVTWMAGFMAAGGIKLNFLNFVAFPITFGNGVDYAVNVMRRFVDELETHGGERWAAVRASVEGTGGAVVLCSLTTVIGYISLYASSNKALNSFGAAMAISEITCVVAGVLTLPAMLLLLPGRRR